MASKSKKEIVKALQELFLNVDESPLALTGNLKMLEKAAKKVGISKQATLKYLRGEPAFTLHRPCRVHFERSRTLLKPEVDELWQADLVEMKDTERMIALNRRTKFLLTVIDTLSKYAWVVPLPNRSGKRVAEALEKIFRDSKRVPKKLQTDEGKEFYNAQVKKVLDLNGVHHYSTRGEPKAAIVERFNRTLKERTYRFMTANNTLKYEQALPTIVANYNATYHRSIGMSPNEVMANNVDKVWRKLMRLRPPLRGWKFRPGDFVRTTKLLGKDRRQSKFGQRASKAMYTVSRRARQPTDGVNYYTLEDWRGTNVKGRFYEPQLQKVRGLPNRWRVEKVHKRRGKGAKKQVLVSWQGLSPEYQTWILHKDYKTT